MPYLESYYRTLITVADDCPVSASVVPVPRGGRRTVAVLQYEMVAERPGQLTQEDVVFLSWLRRQEGGEELAGPELEAARAGFFSRSQACLRASPLPKKYGFGLLFDEEGRISLCPMESEEYVRILDDPGEVTIVKAMRSSRR
ncbi:DUF6157 family protein [Streptomyces sp. 4N509B]|uniref:DUF6157 family protein n=1 Tax=Streptomyces sp. 4N509B TaxID=3457413 RepID=UPI003FD12E60